MPSLFEWLDKINSGKDLVLDADNPFKDYPAYQILQGLSQNMDTVLLANEMNKRPGLSKEMQFAFLDKATLKKKRFGKWVKVEAEADKEDVETVSEFYQVNRIKAAEYLRMIQPHELEFMRNRINKGGAQMIGGKGKKKA